MFITNDDDHEDASVFATWYFEGGNGGSITGWTATLFMVKGLRYLYKELCFISNMLQWIYLFIYVSVKIFNHVSTVLR